MFCKGEMKSVILLLRAFATFSDASGLQMNREKSDIYFNGVTGAVRDEILRVSGFHRGILPFRYLGVTISHKKLAVRDCELLIAKIVQRIRSWGARKLSYAGRLVLVQSVLSQMHTYWARLFIIPVTVIVKVDAICRNYLWEGNENYSKAPLVKWEMVCLEKKYGGLGVMSSTMWNIALIAKYTWWIASKADHLWIKWVNQVYLKGKPWKEYTPSVNSSWVWRKICNVKDRVKDGYMDNNWLEPHGKYTVKAGYKWLMGEKAHVPWFHFVWNRMAVPRHSFIGWIVMQNRLLTCDRLSKMGVDNEGMCFLCGDMPETHKHLFYECEYSRRCLKVLGEWLQLAIPGQLVWQWAITVRLKSLTQKKVIQAAILGITYQIWRERNRARMEKMLLTPHSIVMQIKSEIKAHFVLPRTRRSMSVEWLCRVGII